MLNKKRVCVGVAGVLAVGVWNCGSSNASNDAAVAPDAESQTASDGTGAVEATNPDNLQDGSRRSTQLTDSQIAQITDSVNSAEIEQAQVAQQKSNDERVKRFAAMMIEHHTRARAEQSALKLDLAESPLSRQLAGESQATLATLKAKEGADFDRAYMQAQVEGHRKALDTIKNDLEPSAQSSALRSYLGNLTPQVEQHLDQARSAQQALVTRANNGSSSSNDSSSVTDSSGPTGSSSSARSR